ncbi:hypothetical protein [Bradyrhizobium sp. URHD0069]|uniref:hypothetical protein n=1 Tax=Bradyrhizobium sp. URHD0069 TaxID=1380355 RepID=UPI0004973F60|nr:hypothetical protein [Bradyrhizobium sp. URHD0069]
MLTFVFYGLDGISAKARAKELRTREARATAVQADMWSSNVPQSDHIEFMPDVAPWHRERIEAVYGVVSVQAGPEPTKFYGEDIPIDVGGTALMGCKIVEGPLLYDAAVNDPAPAPTKRPRGRPRKVAA